MAHHSIIGGVSFLVVDKTVVRFMIDEVKYHKNSDNNNTGSVTVIIVTSDGETLTCQKEGLPECRPKPSFLPCRNPCDDNDGCLFKPASNHDSGVITAANTYTAFIQCVCVCVTHVTQCTHQTGTMCHVILTWQKRRRGHKDTAQGAARWWQSVAAVSLSCAGSVVDESSRPSVRRL